MKDLSISDIAKKPSLLDEVDIAKIVNKKTKEVKGFFISAKDLPIYKELLEEIAYRKWLKKNSGLTNTPKDLEGVFDDVIEELGDQL